MKYYVNDRLVRTSKNHIYTHAVMRGDDLIACCGSLDLAGKRMSSEIGRYNSSINDCKNAIIAIDNGVGYYWSKVCGRSYKVEIRHSRKEYEDSIAKMEGNKKLFHIVELDARA